MLKVLVFILSFFAAVFAYSQDRSTDLFVPSSIPSSDAAGGFESLSSNLAISQATLDSSFIELNTSVAARFSGSHPSNEQTVKMILPGEVKPIQLRVENRETYVEGLTTVSGRVENFPGSYFVFSLRDQVLVGKLQLNGFNYLIEPAEQSKLHRVRKTQPAILPKDKHDTFDEVYVQPQHAPADIAAEIPSTLARMTSGNVSILFFYARDVFNAEALAANMLAEFNRALRLSGVSGKWVSSAGVVPLETTFGSRCKAQIIRSMTRQEAEFTDIERLRANANADVVFTIVNDRGPGFGQCFTGFAGRVGGIARHPSLFTSGRTGAFAVSADTYLLGDNTGVHEVGHVLGLHHPSDRSATSPRIGLGNPDLGWQTIMGSYDVPGCEFQGINTRCVRLNRFSNPDQSYQGAPLGSATQNASLWLRSTAMDTVSLYSNRIPPRPQTPAGLAVHSEQCYGLNSVRWQASDANTLEYRLYRSSTSNFRQPQLVYHGRALNEFINVPRFDGTWYLRVKACNAGGCSAYSNQRAARYVNYCR